MPILRSHVSRTGFSMIELLVCISIIVLLMALLLPVLESARGRSQITQSAANERQIFLGVSNYANDNHDQLMEYRLNAAWRNGFGMGGYINYPSLLVLGGYVDNPYLFWGPMRDTAFLAPYRNAIQNPKGSNGDIYYFSGYGLNAEGACPAEADQPLVPRRLSRAGRMQPGQLLLIGEQFDYYYYNAASGYRDGIAWITYCGNSGYTTQNFITFHGETARAYLDGHMLVASAIDLGYTASDMRNGIWTSSGYAFGSNEPWYTMTNPLNYQ